MKLILLSSFLFLLAPCNGTKRTSSATDQNQVGDPKTVTITYQRGVCFGKCPAFLLTINGEKNIATYKGEMNVDKIGEYERPVSEQEIKTLMEAFDKYHFFELKDEYTSASTDHPTVYTTYTSKGKTKKIRDTYGAPEDLKAIEKLLEDFANSEGWKKTSKEE
jgi:hypothetical protein